jgi:DNA-binding PadR family transcriptional regulator
MAQDGNERLIQRRPLLPSCLLLLLGEAPGHGYELAERLKQWGFELSGPGPVYRELRVLEENGLVRSTWSPPRSGPVPRVYELTSTGRKALDKAADDLTDLEDLLREFHQRHAALRAARPEPRRRRDR